MGLPTFPRVDHTCKSYTMEECVSNKHQDPNNEVHKRGGKPLFVTIEGK